VWTGQRNIELLLVSGWSFRRQKLGLVLWQTRLQLMFKMCRQGIIIRRAFTISSDEERAKLSDHLLL
jgi:hypothetical protein